MKPKVIILGGCGMIGRNLVSLLVEDDVASEIRVVDKVPPQTAWLSNQHKLAFDDPRVSFKSANLINSGSCSMAFTRDDGQCWDWAINCAGETRLAQADPIYQEGILQLSLNCAKQAASEKVHSYLEFSCCMASNKKVASRESDPSSPVIRIARWKAKVEQELHNFPTMRVCILRPAIVYGPGDKAGLMSFVMLGAIYRHLGECMRLLWSRDVKMNTVHVRDVSRAVVHVLSRSSSSQLEIYHVVDESDSTQGSVCDVLAEIFPIQFAYWGSTLSGLAKADLESVAEDVNEKHLEPWAAMCAVSGVVNTPLSPYLAPEALENHHVHMNGDKLKSTGFTYSVPNLTSQALQQVLNIYIDMGLFPNSAHS